FDDSGGSAFIDRRAQLFDTRERCHCVFDAASDFRLHLSRRYPWISHGDDDRRELDVRTVEHTEFGEAHKTGNGQGDEQHHHRYRVANGPSYKVHGLRASQRASTMLTISPSFRNPAPLVTMRAPASRPLFTSI